MDNLKHLLVPTAFDKASAAALELAASMAKAFDARLTLLHVWELPIYPYMDFMLNSEVISEVEDAAVKERAQALEELKKSLAVAQSRRKSVMPWEGALAAIPELGANWVIMRTHGRHGLSRLTPGSVAERAVLTVHAPSEF